MQITFQKWRDAIYLYTLTNDSGARVQVTNYGATLVAVQLADGTHLVLGFDNLQAYLDDRCYMGSTVGPVANRIGMACFTLDGQNYALEPNDGRNNNHSGSAGVHAKIFTATLLDDALELHYRHVDGAGGFPGNIALMVRYQWNNDNKLTITYSATTDSAAVVNITNHAYFNLSGTNAPVLDHHLYIPATQVLEAGADYIPTGAVVPAGDRAFTPAQPLRAAMNDYFILDSNDQLKLAARLEHKASGRCMEVYTTYPGLMVYTADYLASQSNGSLGRPYAPFGGVCLECQYYPDAPNHVAFPSIILRPGQVYHEQIQYHFMSR